jgi:hypothetical protein
MGKRTVVYLSSELWAYDGGEDFGQYPHPCFFVHNVQSLESFAHGPRQDVVGLQEPAPARPMLLASCGAVAVASKEDDFIFISLEQFVFFGQTGEDIGQEQVVVGVVRVWEGSSIEDEDGPPLLRRQGRAVEDRGGNLGQVVRIVGTVLGRGHCGQGGAAEPAGEVSTHAAHGDRAGFGR